MNPLSKRSLIVFTIVLIVVLLSTSIVYERVVRRVAAKDIVGVIDVRGYIIAEEDRDLYVKAVRLALENESVKAVVVRVDSGGGIAPFCEDVYLSLRKLAESKPMVVVIEGIAASGGFMIALASDYIYATPSSLVGNVGVIALAPIIVVPTEAILETGPYKYAAFSIREFPFTVRRILNNFLEIVEERRGEKLNVSITEVAEGKLYVGLRALELGLIDGIYSYPEAVARAAELAGVSSYEVVDLTRLVEESEPTNLGRSLWEGSKILSPQMLRRLSRSPMDVYLIPSFLINESELYGLRAWGFEESETPEINVTGRVVIDLSHKNAFFPLLMVEFLRRINANGVKFYLNTGNLTRILEMKPKSLVITTPYKEYTPSEVKAIREFVENGGKLLLMHDPGAYFPSYMNFISHEFGILFATGYLYNLEDNYGIYRNVPVRNFTKSELTKELREVVAFTCTAVYCHECEVLAITSNTTVLSILDVTGPHYFIVRKGDVLAIGDLTFLMDPFVVVADNSKLLDNIVEWLIED